MKLNLLALPLLIFALMPCHGSLIAHYTFDDLDPGPFTNTFWLNDEASVSGNNRLFINGNPNIASGVDGEAIFIDIPAAHGIFSSFTGNDGFLTEVSQLTIAAWIRPDAFPTPAIDVASIAMFSVNGNSLNSRAVLALNSTGQLELGARSTDSESYQSRFTTSAVGLNDWNHVAGVIDYAADTLAIYINGNLQVLVPGSINFSQNVTDSTSSDFFTLGSTGTSMEFFSGGLDDVRIYDNALSASEISALAAIPEPSVAWLILIGITVYALRRHFRRAEQ